MLWDKLQFAWVAWDWVSDNWLAVIGGVTTILSGAAVIAAVIPGDQPDKTIERALAWVKKYSRKPADPGK